jgi:hypothetical protein
MDKDSSVLQKFANYGCKKSYNSGPWEEMMVEGDKRILKINFQPQAIVIMDQAKVFQVLYEKDFNAIWH